MRAAPTLVTLLVVALLGGLGWVVAPQVAGQIEELGHELPALTEAVVEARRRR